jgi:PAS domain S-box-containing protein
VKRVLDKVLLQDNRDRDALVVMNDTGRITDWNSRAAKTFGWSRKQVIGKSLAETIVPIRCSEAHKNDMQMFFETGEGLIVNKRIELWAMHRDGREFPVELAVFPVKHGGGWIFSVFIRDISERKQAEQALAIKPAPIADILSAVNEAQNKSRQRQKSSALTPDDSYVLEQYNVALVRKLEERNNELHDALAVLNTAQEHVLELNRNLESRVEQRTAALRATNRELEAFAYSVSHDLRAALSTIEGFAQLLNEAAGPQLSAEHRELLEYIVTSTKKMGQIIEALLQFARSSESELGLVEVDLEQLLDDAIAATQADASDRHVIWQRSHLPKAFGDATLLRQVLVNLLGNAIKYTRGRDPAVIEVGTRKGRKHEVVVFVRDNGIGFDMQRAHKLFGPFQRLNRASEFEGTGIGLANAHRIVTRLGGAIWAEAEVERGATFYFSLPATGSP